MPWRHEMVRALKDVERLTIELEDLKHRRYVRECSNNWFESSGEGSAFRRDIRAKQKELEAACAVVDHFTSIAQEVGA